MEANGIHLMAIRNIKTLMGEFGFSDRSAWQNPVPRAVQTAVQQMVCTRAGQCCGISL